MPAGTGQNGQLGEPDTCDQGGRQVQPKDGFDRPQRQGDFASQCLPIVGMESVSFGRTRGRADRSVARPKAEFAFEVSDQ